MNKIERGENKEIDILWRKSPGDSDTRTRFKCHRPGEDATLVFPRCLNCPTFQTTMEEAGLRTGDIISDVLREMTSEDIWDYKPPTP